MTYAEQLAEWERDCQDVDGQREQLLKAHKIETEIRRLRLFKSCPYPPKPEPPKEETRTMYGDEYRRGLSGDLEVWDDDAWRRSAWTWDSLHAHVTSSDLLLKSRGEIEAVLSLRHCHLPEPPEPPKEEDELTRLRGTVSDYSDVVTAMKIRIAILQESLHQAKTELAVRGPSKFRLPASPAAEPDKEG